MMSCATLAEAMTAFELVIFILVLTGRNVSSRATSSARLLAAQDRPGAEAVAISSAASVVRKSLGPTTLKVIPNPLMGMAVSPCNPSPALNDGHEACADRVAWLTRSASMAFRSGSVWLTKKMSPANRK